MVKTSDIRWFKETYHTDIRAATDGTVFDPDMLCAIACQETGSLWSPMRARGLARDDIVRLCCGDTLDSDKGRRAGPHSLIDAGMPGRAGDTPGTLRDAIHRIIAFLNPQNIAAHARYAPRG